MAVSYKPGGEGKKFISFEVGYRLAFMCVMALLPKGLDPLVRLAPHEFFYALTMAGSLILLAVTFTMGHRPVAADYRAIIGYALLHAAATWLAVVLSPHGGVTKALVVSFHAVEYGFWMTLVGRNFWPRFNIRLPVFSIFDGIFNDAHGDSLGLAARLGGYTLLIGFFAAGVWLGVLGEKLDMAIFIGVPGLMLLIVSREEEALVADLVDRSN